MAEIMLWPSFPVGRFQQDWMLSYKLAGATRRASTARGRLIALAIGRFALAALAFAPLFQHRRKGGVGAFAAARIPTGAAGWFGRVLQRIMLAGHVHVLLAIGRPARPAFSLASRNFGRMPPGLQSRKKEQAAAAENRPAACRKALTYRVRRRTCRRPPPCVRGPCRWTPRRSRRAAPPRGSRARSAPGAWGACRRRGAARSGRGPAVHCRS